VMVDSKSASWCPLALDPRLEKMGALARTT
jgi:hypothetical protein